MPNPGMSVLNETLLESTDQFPVESLTGTLTLGTIRNARPLGRALDLAHFLQEIRFKFAAVVGRQKARWADGASKVLESFADADCVLVLQFVELHVPRKDVYEDKDMVKSKRTNRKRDQVTDDVVPHVFRLNRDARRPVGWDRLSFLVTDLTVGDKILDVLVHGGPNGVPLDGQKHLFGIGMASHV